MANMISQRYVDFSNEFVIGIHRLKATSATDAFTVPTLATTTLTTDAGSAFQALRSGDSTANLTIDDANTISVDSVNGEEVVIITIHAPSVVNYGPEA